MVIVGIDPGLAIVGFGVIETDGRAFRVLNYGVITTPAGMPTPRRLSMIYEDVTELMNRYHPDAVALEELFFYANVTTGINVAQARGVALIAAAHAVSDEQLFEYTPMQIKLATCGYGHADKHQIQQMVKTLLRLKEIPQPDDAADALAVAICHAQTFQLGASYTIR